MAPRLHQFADNALLVSALYQRIATLAEICLELRGYFSIILAGGTTPRALYQQLRHLPTDWQRWHIYFSDERYLPAGDAARNDSMVAEAWLDHVAVPAAHIHAVPTADNIIMAATAYASELQRAPGFDLALLGLGEDGHTASLFPGDSAGDRTAELAIAVLNAPKPPPQRVSMSATGLSSASAVWFIVTGDSKRHALQEWLAGAPLPPHAIRPASGIDIFTDILDE